MNKDIWQEFQDLKATGLELESENSIKFNSGSETIIHAASKAIAGRILIDNGYRVNSEVECDRGEIDLVCWSDERLNYAVEFEHDVLQETKKDKLQRYVRETGLDDMILIDLNTCSTDIIQLSDQIRQELGL